MTAITHAGTVAGAVLTGEADLLVDLCASGETPLHLEPRLAYEVWLAGGPLPNGDAVTVEAAALLAWLCRNIETLYGVSVPASARHTYLSGRRRLPKRRGTDPGIVAMQEAGWRRYDSGRWREPAASIDLLGVVAVARGFGHEVRAALELRSMTLRELADQLGVTRQRLGRALEGPTMPATQYTQICVALGLEPAEHATLHETATTIATKEAHDDATHEPADLPRP